jgi:uncharacterized protein YciI
MSHIFVVNRVAGSGWDPGKTMTHQKDWSEHADVMNQMHDDGFVLLAGPVANAEHFESMMIVRGESEGDVRARFAVDPWVIQDISRIVRVTAWTVRLGTLPT